LTIRADRRQVKLMVTDHGGGVPAELQKCLFEPFTKSAERAAQTAAGVGLGLSLVRQIVRSLGGQVRYAPTVDGASFSICVPNRV